jgi:tetratricopeptide (TPR) repeat protein
MASSEFPQQPDESVTPDKVDKGSNSTVKATDAADNARVSQVEDEAVEDEINGLKQQAMVYFQQAYQAQQQQRLTQAIALYQQSINTYPTAEAHTFLGWVYSFQQRWDEAIAECYRAIAVDSTFGNPYNDIGAYLIEQGDYDAAIPWLKRALAAPRYECYFYPHCNLGRIYERQKRYLLAMQEYSQALALNPRYLTALQGIRRLQKLLN